MLDMSLEQGVEKVSLIRIEADMAESKRRQELDDARDERCKSLLLIAIFSNNILLGAQDSKKTSPRVVKSMR